MSRFGFQRHPTAGARGAWAFERLEERLTLAGDFDVALIDSAPQVLVTPGMAPLSYEVSLGPTTLAPSGLGPQVSVNYAGAGVDIPSIPEEFLPIELTKTYALSFWARSGDEFGQRYNPANQQSFGFAAYDSDHKLIGAEHVLKHPGAVDTTLAAPLAPGDTVLRLTSATGWSSASGAAAASRGLAWYGYQNSSGQTYANYTYTRNVALGGAGGLWNPGAVSGNVITLSAPWSGPLLPTGTAVRNTGAGSEYQFAALDHQAVGADWNWTHYPAVVGGGVAAGGANAPVQFRPGTAFIKPVILANQHGAPDNYVRINAAICETSAAAPFGGLNREVIDLNAAPRAWEITANQAPSATLIKIDPAAQYRLQIEQYNSVQFATNVFGFNSFDIDQKQIHPLHVTRFAGATDTVLAAPLSPGATSLLVADATGWSTAAWQAPQSRSLAWYGYQDSTGRTYDNYTYTRNVAVDFDKGVWGVGGIAFDTAAGAYRITLTKPWAGPALPAGAAIRNADSGEVPSLPHSPQLLATSTLLTDYAATIGGGVWLNGARSETLFRPGTAYIQAHAFAARQAQIAPLGYAEPTSPLTATADLRVTLTLDVLDSALRALPPQAGDFNRDGAVDAADYTVWRDQQAAPGSAPLTAADYEVWRSNFGQLAAASIPGDANRDGEVNAADYTVLRDRNASAAELNAWRTNFGAQVPLTITAASARFGTAVITTTPGGLPAVRYQSPAWFVGTEVLTYSVRNAQSGVVTQRTAHLQIAGDNTAQSSAAVQALATQGANTANTAPVVRSDASYTIGPGDTLVANGGRASTLLESITDADPVLAVELVAAPRHGTLNLKYDGTFVYTADPGFVGGDTFQVAVFDGLNTTFRSATIEVLASDEKLLESRMRQIGLAAAIYESSRSRLPGPFAGTGPTAGQQLSWRVALLPFLGMQSLYNALTVGPAPTGSAADWMPDLFCTPGDAVSNALTRFLVVSNGDGTQYFRTVTSQLVGPRPSDLGDGAPNTLLFVQVGVNKALSWLTHEGFLYSSTNPLAALGTISGNSLQAVTADGAVRRLPTNLTGSEFTSLLTVNTGEVLDPSTLSRRVKLEQLGEDVLETTNASQTINRLKAFSLAALNFYDTNNELPRDLTATATPTNRLLSWRVRLLPFLGHGKLSAQFRLNEPWNSPHNLTLLDKMPDLFRSAGDAPNTTTTRIQALLGPGAAFENNADGSPRRLTISSIIDGTQNTLAFAEVGLDRAVPWTKPEDAAFTTDPWAALGSLAEGRIPVAFLDGHAANLPVDLGPATFAALVTRAGREILADQLGGARESVRTGAFGNNVTVAVNELKLLILGAHNFASATLRFPTNISSTAGTSLLSWRVALLPYLEQQALYDQFNRTEPWDSPHNLALLDKMPEIFRGLGTPVGSGLTSIMRFVGTGAPPLNVRLRDITDGTSQTIFAVDAGPDVAVPWTKPDDLPFISSDPASVLGELGSILLAAYFDGHIGILPSTIVPTELRAAITYRSDDAVPAVLPLGIPTGFPTAAPLEEEAEPNLPPLLAAFATLSDDDLLIGPPRDQTEEAPYFLDFAADNDPPPASWPALIPFPELALW